MEHTGMVQLYGVHCWLLRDTEILQFDLLYIIAISQSMETAKTIVGGNLNAAD